MTVTITAGQRHLRDGFAVAVIALPAFRNNSFPAFTDTLPRCGQPVDSKIPRRIPATGDMRYRDFFQRFRNAGRQFVGFAMVLTSSPMVVSCHDSSRWNLACRESPRCAPGWSGYQDPPVLNLIDRKIPLIQQRRTRQPSHNVSTAPRRGNSTFPSCHRAQCRAGQLQSPYCPSWWRNQPVAEVTGNVLTVQRQHKAGARLAPASIAIPVIMQ